MHVIKKRPADWTADDIAAFWDWQSKNAARRYEYFTSSLAPGIVRFLNKKGLLKGEVLDYGCGGGHLLEQMITETGVNFYGLDFSAGSIEETKKRTAGKSNMKQLVLADNLPTVFANEQFDSIMLIETIEHLQDDTLYETMKELYRILKRKGRIFITTPFNENLDQNLNFCPFCKSEFHAVQHMQSFDVEALTALAGKHGFAVESCTNINIDKFKIGPVRYFIKSSLKKMAIAAGLKEKGAEMNPNLIAIFVKP